MVKENKYKNRNNDDEADDTLEYILSSEECNKNLIEQDIKNLANIAYINTFCEKHNMTNINARKFLITQLIEKLDKFGLSYVSKPHYPLPNEIKFIIRMDFYGVVRNYKHNKSINTYDKRVKFDKFLAPENTKDLDVKDYNLSNSPTWKIFSQFKGFNYLETKLIKTLISEGIKPDSLKHLNAYDYSTLLYKAIQAEREIVEDYSSTGAYLGARCRFVKDFIRRNKVEFRKYLENNNINHDYINSLIRVMKTRGITSDIDVLEEYFSAHSIRKLKENKIRLIGAREGAFITREHRQFLRKLKKLECIMILDEDGNKIKGPEFSVHHKVAVKDCGQETNFADVNLFKNLCLIIEPYHSFVHALDKKENSFDVEQYVARIELEEDIVFYGGFNDEFKIYHHYNNNHPRCSSNAIVEDYKKNKEEDEDKSENNIRKNKEKYRKNRRQRKIDNVKRRKANEGR